MPDNPPVHYPDYNPTLASPPLSDAELAALLTLGRKGIGRLIEAQRQALGTAP